MKVVVADCERCKTRNLVYSVGISKQLLCLYCVRVTRAEVKL